MFEDAKKHLLRTIELYRRNIKIVLLYSVLLAFGFLFSIFENVRISSGNIFLKPAGKLEIIVEVILFLLFLLFYSAVSAILIFAIRKELSKVRVEYYMREVLQKFVLKIFGFYLFFSILFLGLSILSIEYWFLEIVAFIIALLLLFTPQAIIIDELNVENAISKSIEFIFSYPKRFLASFFMGIVLLLLGIIVEILFDPLFYSGKVFCALFITIIGMPLFEIAKSYFYMLKFKLVEAYLK